MLSQCYAQMKISFPGLIFAQYKSINIKHYSINIKMFHGSTPRCFPVAPSGVVPFHHDRSTVPLSNVPLFHHEVFYYLTMIVSLFHHQMFYCSAIRCCKCPQARESEVELIDFVMFFFVTQVPGLVNC